MVMPKFADLRAWRKQHGLSPQADIAIVSHNLDFPIPKELTANGRKVVIFTTEQADAKKIKAVESDAVRVRVVGKNEVDGAQLIARSTELGYHTIYSGAGPQIMHVLLSSKVLNRLYLTQANKLLGGDPYASIVDGGLFDPPVNLRLNTIYWDAAGLDGLGQLFVSYDRG